LFIRAGIGKSRVFRRLVLPLVLLSTIPFFEPIRLWPVDFATGSFVAGINPCHDGSALVENLDEKNLEEIIPLSPRSRLRLDFAAEPELDIFYRSFAAIYEKDVSLFSLKALTHGHVPATFMIGLVTLPAVSGVLEELPQADPGSTLLLTSAQLDFELGGNLDAVRCPGIYMDVVDTLFVRWAYNLCDLGPTYLALREGQTLSEVLAYLNSGLSYSTIENRLSARLGWMGSGRKVETSIQATWKDLLYMEYSAGITCEAGSVLAKVSYDRASYDALNGISSRQISAELGFSTASGEWKIEQTWLLGGVWSFGVYADINLEPYPRSSESRTKCSYGAGTQGCGPEQVSAVRNEYHHPLWELAKAQYVPWDDSLLDICPPAVSQPSSF
jgi:hypothetical protein